MRRAIESPPRRLIRWIVRSSSVDTRRRSSMRGSSRSGSQSTHAHVNSTRSAAGWSRTRTSTNPDRSGTPISISRVGSSAVRGSSCPRKPHVPTCVRPMGEPLPPPRISTEMPSSIQEGLDSIYEALVAAPGDNVAERFAAATERLLGARLKTPCTVVFASRLFETPIGREILERIGSEPFACVRTWNEAVRSVPRSARELRIEEGDADATEAPVWALDERGRRRPGTIRDVRRALAGEQQVLPRAFLMTAIVRAGLCTEMIHGTGGAQYELVTRSWASAFLGIELAPISIVTETVPPAARCIRAVGSGGSVDRGDPAPRTRSMAATSGQARMAREDRDRTAPFTPAKRVLPGDARGTRHPPCSARRGRSHACGRNAGPPVDAIALMEVAQESQLAMAAACIERFWMSSSSEPVDGPGRTPIRRRAPSDRGGR